MKNISNKLSVVFATLCCVLFFTAGCNKNKETVAEAQTLKEAVEQLEAEGKYPKLDRTTSLLGEDKDGNGIRDDIDTYIDSLPDTPEQKGSLRQTAVLFQTILTLDPLNVNDVAKENKLSYQALHCSRERYQPESNDTFDGGRWRLIFAMTYNTKERSSKYHNFSKNMVTRISRVPDGGCDEKYIK